MKHFSKIILVAMTIVACLPSNAAKKFQNFKVSTYIRAQDVARMADDKFLNQTWETVSSQVDLDKIYLETHRDAFTVDEKTMQKVKTNIIMSMIINVTAVILSAAGILTPVTGALRHNFGSVFVVVNAALLLRYKDGV